ncbi:hypothetical protein B0H17DRAFT_1139999 [Mycena rosella]|uniref:Uncharacterized protein n=1 Tax=Mycena rosella TaxID=1033263 RepID=A0AAD7G883_MYCRO|nr:hypothetical protein B0H17DRAFT_1139999 [Mycena rosella]
MPAHIVHRNIAVLYLVFLIYGFFLQTDPPSSAPLSLVAAVNFVPFLMAIIIPIFLSELDPSLHFLFYLGTLVQMAALLSGVGVRDDWWNVVLGTIAAYYLYAGWLRLCAGLDSSAMGWFGTPPHHLPGLIHRFITARAPERWAAFRSMVEATVSLAFDKLETLVGGLWMTLSTILDATVPEQSSSASDVEKGPGLPSYLEKGWIQVVCIAQPSLTSR